MRSYEAVLAEAAVRVLAKKGSRGFTHRAVDEEAGLPQGTASRYARSRDALFLLAAYALFSADVAASGNAKRGGANGPIDSIDDVVQGLVTAAEDLLQFPERYKARLELELEATRSEVLGQNFRMGRAAFVGALAQSLASLGVRKPTEHADMLIAMFNAVLHRELVLGEPRLSTAQLNHLFSSYIGPLC